MQTINQQMIAPLLSARPHNSHKGLFGNVGVLGGAQGMLGAPLLAARAALQMGAGCVHVGFMHQPAPMVDWLQPELMLHSAADLMSQTNLSVLAIGCGLGQTLHAEKYLIDSLRSEQTLVLDADALNLIAYHRNLIPLVQQRQATTILTPHPGEAARLLQCSTQEIQQNREAAAKALYDLLACALVLKGADSLCVSQAGQLFQNPTGNPGMSCAGMGDVLAGMLAGLLAQHRDHADQVLLLAVLLHGAAGDALAIKGTTLGMTASELSLQARQLLNDWQLNGIRLPSMRPTP